MNNKSHLLIIILLACSFGGYSQVNDAGLWASATVRKQLTFRHQLELTHEIRFNENISELATSFTQAGIEYKIAKGFTAGLNYRFTQRRQLDDSYSLRHRLFLDLSYRHKFNIVAFTLRERVQSQVQDVQTGEDGFDPEYYLRSKLTAKFDFYKKYNPYVSAEAFYQLNNEEGNEIDNIRFAAGIDYDFNKRHSITLFYLIDKEVNVNNPLTGYVSGIGYTYSY